MPLIVGGSSSSGSGVAPIFPEADSKCLSHCSVLRSVELLPQYGFVLIDVRDGKTWAIDRRTLERIALPDGGDWSLLQDAKGWCIFMDSNEVHDSILCEDHMHRALALRGDELVYVENVPGTAKKRIVSLDAKLLAFDGLRIQFPVFGLSAYLSLGAVFLQWPRAGWRYIWQFCGVYKALQLTSFSKQASKWAFDMESRWCKVLHSAHGIEIESCMFHGVERCQKVSRAPGELPTIVVPSSSCHTMALLSLLARWSSMPTRLGGMQPAGAGRARVLLDSLLSGAVALRPFKLGLVFSQDWRDPWPLFIPPFDRCLDVGADCLVDLTPWKDSQHASEGVGARWMTHMIAANEGATTIKLIDMITAALTNRLDSLATQLLNRSASELEKSLYVAVKSKVEPKPNALRASMDDIKSSLWNRHLLDNALLRTVHGGIELLAGTCMYFLATDKFNNGGLWLQNNIIGGANNCAIIGTPQVIFAQSWPPSIQLCIHNRDFIFLKDFWCYRCICFPGFYIYSDMC